MDPIYVIGVMGSIITGVVTAGLKRAWVWGWTYSDKVKDLADMTEDRDFWRNTALKLLQHNDAIVKKVVKDE